MASTEADDIDAHNFWTCNINQDKVPNHVLTQKLSNAFETKSAHVAGTTLDFIVDYVIDFKSEGWVSEADLQAFVHRFGPFKSAIENCARSLFDEYSLRMHPWFHGNLSKKEALEILKHRRRGSYLLRFSGTSAVRFALEYVSTRKQYSIRRLKVYRTRDGFTCPALNDRKVFDSLPVLIEENSKRLIYPIPSNISGYIKQKLKLLAKSGRTGLIASIALPQNSDDQAPPANNTRPPPFNPYSNIAGEKVRALPGHDMKHVDLPQSKALLSRTRSAEDTRSRIPGAAPKMTRSQTHHPQLKRGLSHQQWEELGELGRHVMRNVYTKGKSTGP